MAPPRESSSFSAILISVTFTYDKSQNVILVLTSSFKTVASVVISVLAWNEEFSKIAVINFFFTVLKKKPVICGGGFCGEIFLSHANQKFNTCLLTCRQTRKIYEHSHRPVCQYIAPCVIIALNVIAIDKFTYNMLFIFCYNPLEVHE